MRHLACVLTLTVLASASLVHAQPMPSDFGPALPAPEKQLIPTVNVASVQRWQGHAHPTVAAGFAISAYANGLDHPRWLYVLPNGDVLVAQTNAPPKPADNQGIKGAIAQMQMKKAGAGTSSANRITRLLQLLRPAYRHARQAAAARYGGQGERARLRAGRAYGVAGAGFL